MKKIGVEEHFLTENYRNVMRSRKEFPKREMVEQGGKTLEREWWSPTNFSLIDPDLPEKVYNLGEERLRDMDEAGIDMQVLSFSFPGIEPFNALDGTAMARDINDELAEVVKRYPERFAGFAAIAPQDPMAAADELERAVKKLGFKGAVVNGNIRGEYLDDEKYWVIFERAEKLDVPIYIHPRAPSEDMIKPYSVWPVLALAGCGFAAEASLHALRLICRGVFDEYPGLKIILGHLGEGIPYWLWRLDSRWPQDEKGIYVGPSKKLEKTPSQYFKDNFYVTTSGMFWQPVIQFACSVLGTDKVLFATDYPYEVTEEAVQVIESMPMSDSDKEKICHLNAERLLRL